MYWCENKNKPPKYHFPVWLLPVFLMLCFLDGCSTLALASNASHPQSVTALANPASQNCIRQGGALTIQKRGDDGEYGVCVFEDNRQCEEWAMLRGACPVGGVKITGYLTSAAQYCAVTGGQYRISSGERHLEQEQGSCSLAAKTCDAWAFYNGRCRLSD
jgi:putative hemolysin